jgi:hypothetical protein
MNHWRISAPWSIGAEWVVQADHMKNAPGCAARVTLDDIVTSRAAT